LKLYEIADEIEVILARDVDHETGELNDETLAKLESLEMARDEKALAVAAYLKGELAEADAVMREVESLTKRAKGHRGRAERLVGYLQTYIPAGTDPISDARSRIAWRKNPPKVELYEGEVVPPEYQRVIPEKREPNRKAIADALKVGVELSFAKLAHSQRLEVK